MELRGLMKDKEDIKVEMSKVEIQQKGRQEELYNSELQDIRFLEKTLEKMKVDDENENMFLKKQLAQLTNERIRLQQHVISLTSRVSNTEQDINENASGPATIAQ